MMAERPCDAPQSNPVWRIHLLCIAVSLLAVPLAHAQNEGLEEPMGGKGGDPFLARRPQGELLTGMDLWANADIDAIRPICVPAVGGKFHTYPTPPVFGTINKKFAGNPDKPPATSDVPESNANRDRDGCNFQGREYLKVNAWWASPMASAMRDTDNVAQNGEIFFRQSATRYCASASHRRSLA